MSQHWEPPRRPWTRADAYVVTGGRALRRRRLPPGAKVTLVLMAAACLGIGIGSYQAFGPRQIVAPGAVSVPAAETIVPEVQADPADAEWAGKAEGEDSPSTQSGRAGVRLSFGSCKWGGGTNCVVDGDTF